MKTRSISAIAIVIVTIVPALLGGWPFAITMAIVMTLAYHEVLLMLGVGDRWALVIGALSIGTAALLPLAHRNADVLPIALAMPVLLHLTRLVDPKGPSAVPRTWPAALGVTYYLAMPALAAVTLRESMSDLDSSAFERFAHAVSIDERTTAGLGLFLLPLLSTWMSDTCAYLVGKSVGKTKLAPSISPNKTVEGALGGLAASAVTVLLVVLITGISLNPIAALVIGLLLGAAGMLGDLAESVIKRQAGVKDSSHLIPGHGGVLDRIDALLFALLVTWALAAFILA